MCIRDRLKAEGTDEAEQRIENIDELINKAVDYEQGEENPTPVSYTHLDVYKRQLKA